MEQKREGCDAVKANGERCKAARVEGSNFCLFHDPGLISFRRASSAAGGRGNRRTVLPEELFNSTFETSDEIRAAACELFRQVRRGKLDQRTAGTMCKLLKIALACAPTNEREEELAELEAINTVREHMPKELWEPLEPPAAKGGMS